jgi:thiamine kinase-like enzyme
LAVTLSILRQLANRARQTNVYYDYYDINRRRGDHPMPEFITNIDQITPEWLTAVLQRASALERGRVIAVTKHASTHPSGMTARLIPTYSDDAQPTPPARLFLKCSRRDAELGVPGIGNRETQFYNALAGHMQELPVVRCYEAVYSTDVGGAYLLMEDLSETHTALPPSQLPPLNSDCEQIVDALARIHAFWWNDARLGVEIGQMPTEGSLQISLREDAEHVRAFVDFIGDRLAPARRAIYEQSISALLPLHMKRFSNSRHLTITFEDVHAGNFLYPRDPAKDTLRIIDWEQWGINIGPHDLAYMMGLFWFPERRTRLEMPLLQRYHKRLVGHGIENYTWADCWHDYRLSIIQHLFTPIWQWAHGSPPDIWWNHLERICCAFQDLHCQELLADFTA